MICPICQRKCEYAYDGDVFSYTANFYFCDHWKYDFAPFNYFSYDFCYYYIHHSHEKTYRITIDEKVYVWRYTLNTKWQLLTELNNQDTIIDQYKKRFLKPNKAYNIILKFHKKLQKNQVFL